eukprot:TRINITY_DN14329_c0_g1_i1.p1 TRINITY_DN14329_c0_g1~~TRINITY_DN14329_c0_g1_i1.p1  ORF type:complete len:224 (+),score=49.04 TRINITY_DN14329_c0_g1_i1:336-1007(+)
MTTRPLPGVLNFLQNSERRDSWRPRCARSTPAPRHIPNPLRPTPRSRTPQVERILKMQVLGDGRKMFLVKWQGYPLGRCTWEPFENILDPTLVEPFLQGHVPNVDSDVERQCPPPPTARPRPPSTAAARAPHARGSASRLGPPPKAKAPTTMDRTIRSWKKYAEADEVVGKELEEGRKSANRFTEKQRFLEDVDRRTWEQEAELRAAVREKERLRAMASGNPL